MTPELAKLGHVAISTPDLARSTAFFHDILGLEIVEEHDGVVYLRGWGEFEHHSLSLRDGPTGIDHVGWRTRRPEDVDAFAASLRDAGTEVEVVEPGRERGQGAAIRFTTPSGHPFELYYDVGKPLAPEERRSRLKNNSARQWDHGISARRIDHVNLATTDVAGGQRFLCEQLGFKVREYVKPSGRAMKAFVSPGVGPKVRELARPSDEPVAASWMSVTSLVHDLALTLDARRRSGRFHHVAYYVDNWQDVLRGMDILAEHDVPIELGPGRHGIAQSFFCYVKDPGSGHRVEIYSGGYHIFDPDWEPIAWTEEDVQRGLVWWGPPIKPGRGGPLDATTPCAVAAESSRRMTNDGATHLTGL